MAVEECADAQHESTHDLGDFTLKDIRQAVPAHLWRRSTLKSFVHLFIDLLYVFCIAYAATFINLVPSTFVRSILWIVYWIVQGTVATGIWVIAHECGHSAFSDYSLVNNVVGYVLHSLLLVPFFSWKYTHANHHNSTGHMTKDQVFVPPTRSQYGLPPKKPAAPPSKSGTTEQLPKSATQEALAETPIVAFVKLSLAFLLGWPVYLAINSTGQYKNLWSSHFNPFAKIFHPDQASAVFLSDIGLGVVLFGLYWAVKTFGAFEVFAYYFVPYLVVNFWLVIITLLQHTAPYLPHYREKAWTFARGAALTVDRDYGWLLNTLHHHIADAHVAHHFFSTMPFYNAVKATPYIKKALGKFYHKDDTHFLLAAWHAQRQCVYVDDEGDVVFWRNSK